MTLLQKFAVGWKSHLQKHMLMKIRQDETQIREEHFEHIVKIDDHGNYLYFIGTLIVAADCKKPAEASLITMYLVH